MTDQESDIGTQGYDRSTQVSTGHGLATAGANAPLDDVFGDQDWLVVGRKVR